VDSSIRTKQWQLLPIVWTSGEWLFCKTCCQAWEVQQQYIANVLPDLLWVALDFAAEADTLSVYVNVCGDLCG
jgi:hypothetical protein